MLELAEDRRRFGSPRLYELLRRDGLVQNHKSLSGVRVVRVLEKLRLQGRLPQRIKVDNVLPTKSTHCVRQKYPVGAF